MPGYIINGKQIGIEKTPWAKRKCLYLLEGSTYYPLAYFIKDEYADKCMEMLDLLAHAPGLINDAPGLINSTEWTAKSLTDATKGE